MNKFDTLAESVLSEKADYMLINNDWQWAKKGLTLNKRRGEVKIEQESDWNSDVKPLDGASFYIKSKDMKAVLQAFEDCKSTNDKEPFSVEFKATKKRNSDSLTITKLADDHPNQCRIIIYNNKDGYSPDHNSYTWLNNDKDIDLVIAGLNQVK